MSLVVVAASPKQAWDAWTTREGIVSFFAPDARIEPRVGGLWDCVGGLALCQAAGLASRFRLHPDGSVDVATGAGVTLPTTGW